jgi:hypothetical protein
MMCGCGIGASAASEHVAERTQQDQWDCVSNDISYECLCLSGLEKNVASEYYVFLAFPLSMLVGVSDLSYDPAMLRSR